MKDYRFDPRRLTVARWAASLTKKDLAERAGISPASITQYESGRTAPPAETVSRLSLALGVPPAYLHRHVGRRRPDMAARSFFRSLRSTPQRDRDHADALAEHVFDLVEFLDQKVNLPVVNLPQISLAAGDRAEIEDVSRSVRDAWGVPKGPAANVVRLMEANGIVVARLRSGNTRLDAFSRRFGDRPLIVLWADKQDKARSRFDAAHELGHLVMHSDPDPMDRSQEREANMFASAFLMPASEVQVSLPDRVPTASTWESVLQTRSAWGVSAKALLYRARELKALNEAAYRRAMISYNKLGIAERDGTALGLPEKPILIDRALEALGAEWDRTSVAASALLPEEFMEEIAPEFGWATSVVAPVVSIAGGKLGD